MLNWTLVFILLSVNPGRIISNRPVIVRGSRMGRGRQKAKHTKVARELKYFSPDTNYGALERELTHSGEPRPAVDSRLDEDLAKWPEYESTQYEDTYATEEEQKRA